MDEFDKDKFLKQLEMEKALLEDAKKGVKDIGGGLKARLLENINEGKVLNKDALLSPEERMKKRFADMAKVRRETGSTGIPEYDRALSKEGAEAVEKAWELDPAKKFKTYPKAPETEVDYMKKARKVAEDMEKSDPERVARERAARGKELMEKAKESGRQMDRKAWIKDPDVGDKFVMRNKSILDTPEATVKRMRRQALQGIKSAGKKGLRMLPLVGAGMMASDLYAASDDMSKGASLGEAAEEFAKKQSPIPSELLERPVKDISRFMDEAIDARDEKLMEKSSEKAMGDYAKSQARKDRMEGLKTEEESILEKALGARKLSNATRGKELLEEGVSERDPEVEAMMRDINADPEAMLLRNPDRKREAAIKARRRLAEEMMKRNILPKMRD